MFHWEPTNSQRGNQLELRFRAKTMVTVMVMQVLAATFILVYTVFSATDAKCNARDSHVPILAPLPIGFAVFLVHLATIPITGTGINPARSLGAAIIFNKDLGWDDHWIFWVGPFVGAALAALYHQVVIRAIPFK